jgi:cytochrome P450
MSAASLVPRPAHVPESLVVDFDYREPPGHTEDVHLAWKRLHDGPDIVWTPRHGGHWIATRAADIDVMQTDHTRFSYRFVTIPPLPDAPQLAPLEYDPPAHTPLRAVLSPAFGPAVMQRLEADLRGLAVELLETIVPRGHCEFFDDFAKRLPVITFLRLVNLPLEDREHLLELTEKSVRPRSEAERMEAIVGLQQYTADWIGERRRNPGPDLFSRMVNAKINGELIDDYQLAGMLFNVIFGGLDTVASALTFTAHCLATHPDIRQALLNDRSLIPNAIEEFLRRYGIPNTARVITHDFEHNGVSFRQGEQVLLSKTLHGLDERRFPDPLRVDLHRDVRRHAAFGDGPHRCPGSFLARLEMRIFLEEWLARVPDFHVPEGASVVTSSGPVNGMLHLPLVWRRENRQ